MRLIHVLDSLAVGGAEVVAATLARQCRRAGHTTSFLCLYEVGALGLQLRSEGFAVDLVGPGPLPLLGARLLLRFQAARPHVVHCHNATATIAAAWPAKLAGARVISTRHGLVAPPHRRAAELKYALAAVASHRVVGVCDATVANLSRIPLLRRRSLIRIYNGAAGPPNAPVTRTGVGLHLTSVGRLVPLKNFSGLLHAVALARVTEPELRLTIVGGGPQEEQLRRLVADLGLAGAVTLAGEQANIWPYLQTADVFVLASRSEGLPISLLEALAAGLPAIVTDVGGMPEVVELTGAGLVVPSGDEPALAAAIVRLAADPGLRGQLGAAAKAGYARNFSPEAMARAYLAVYQRNEPQPAITRAAQ